MSAIEHVDECVIQWWRGYVKSSFYVLVDGSSPHGRTLIESPLFWSLGKPTLTPDDGPTAAAHQQLVEKLLREGWQPAGAGESWYEQRFVREARVPAADDEVAIQWWRGYVKSSFYVLVDGSSPDDRTLIESPLFWTLGKSSLTPDGPIAAAHQQLVEKLLREGWQPAGAGESWYDQRFVRETRVRVADEQPSPPAPAEPAPLRRETSPKPARPASAEDRALRVVTKPTSPPPTREASTPDPTPKSSPPEQAGKRAPTRSKKPATARPRPGATAAQRQSSSRATAPRRGQRPPSRTTRGDRHRARSRQSTQLVASATVVGWAALAAVVVAALLLALGGS